MTKEIMWIPKIEKNHKKYDNPQYEYDQKYARNLTVWLFDTLKVILSKSPMIEWHNSFGTLMFLTMSSAR